VVCPECGAEYVEGVARCADCGVDLDVPRPPRADVGPARGPDGVPSLGRPAELVCVLRSTDAGLLLVAESALHSAGIPCVCERNDIIDLFGVGRIGGVNPITGVPRILVDRADAEDATAVLEGVASDDEAGAR